VKIKNSRVLITGGAGFIGSHIADQLVKEGAAEIVILDNFVRGSKENLAWASANGPLTIISGDICDRRAMAKAVKGIDLLFHEAAIRITQCAQEPRLALEVLVDGTFTVMEAAVKAQVKKVIGASSASIYGMADKFPTTEQHHAYNNRTLYGAAKVFNESLMRSFSEMYGLDYLMLRPFNVYGPRMDVHGAYTEVFIRWMDRIASGQPPVIFGDGNQTLDFVHVEDVARAYILAAKTDFTDDVFNVASGVETSLNDLAKTLLKVMESDLRPEYGPERKVTGVTRRVADIRKAKRLLGFEAGVSLEDGLRGLVEWWRGTCSIPGSREKHPCTQVAGSAPISLHNRK
jgi:UDP-glucose 4-epimerase